jgi:hypothetical protein
MPSPDDLSAMLRPEPAALSATGVLKVRPARKAKRLQQDTDYLWAQVPLWQLVDRSWDSFYPPKTRVLLYLRIRSHHGKYCVRFTNQMAAEIGLDRFQKSRYLRGLEALGLVAITRNGRSTPEVAVV